MQLPGWQSSCSATEQNRTMLNPFLLMPSHHASALPWTVLSVLWCSVLLAMESCAHAQHCITSTLTAMSFGAYIHPPIKGSDVGGKNLAGAWNLLPSHPHPSGLLYRFHGTRTLPPHEGVTCFDLCLWLHSTPDGMGLTWNLSPSLPEPAQSGPSAQPVPAPHRLPSSPH